MKKKHDAYQSMLNKLRQHSKFFNKIDAGDVQEFISLGKIIRMQPHNLVFHRGTVGKQFYFLLAGKIRIYLLDSNMKKNEVGTLKPLSVIGEISAMTGTRRTAYMDCVEESVLLEFTSEAMRKLEVNRPKTAIQVYKNVISIIAQEYLKPVEDKYVVHHKDNEIWE